MQMIKVPIISGYWAGTLTGQKYRDQTLCPLVVPHFDCHPLTSRPILMDANVRPHRACIVQNYLQQEAIVLLPWPAMSPDMNPAEHLWIYLGRKVNARTPTCQYFRNWGLFLVKEWQQYLQHRLRCLIKGMRKRVQELYRIRGS